MISVRIDNDGQDEGMDRREFMEKLQRALAGGLNSSMVADNMRFYQEYIDSEIRKGRTEEEVIDSLGDPRLLAKSIIEANKRAGESYGSNREYDEELSGADSRERDTYDAYNSERAGRGWVLPGWLLMVIATVVILLFIGIATSLLYIFSPVIIIALVVLLIVKFFQSNTK